MSHYIITLRGVNLFIEQRCGEVEGSHQFGAYFNDLCGNGNWFMCCDLPADFSVDTYTIENGHLVTAPAEVIAERKAALQAEANQAEIAELQAYLTQTDYAAIKCGELGLSMASEYPDLHAQRTEARARINALQEGGAE